METSPLPGPGKQALAYTCSVWLLGKEDSRWRKLKCAGRRRNTLGVLLFLRGWIYYPSVTSSLPLKHAAQRIKLIPLVHVYKEAGAQGGWITQSSRESTVTAESHAPDHTMLHWDDHFRSHLTLPFQLLGIKQTRYLQGPSLLLVPTQCTMTASSSPAWGWVTSPLT